MAVNETINTGDAGHVAHHIALAQGVNGAATEAEMTAHAADSTLHTSGQRTGYAANVTAVTQTITTTSTTIPSTSITLPQISRPQVLRGRCAVKCTTAMTATAGTVTYLVLGIFDDAGVELEGGLISFDASSTNGWATIFVEADIEADTPAHTYHLEISRGGSTAGTFQVLNGSIATAFKTALRAQAA